MKKTTSIPLAILACALSRPVHAAVENGGAPNFEASFGLGAMELDKDRTGIDDTGFGLNMGIRFGADTLPLGAEWRLYGGAFSLDDAEFTEPYGRNRNVEVYLDDCAYSIAGTDFSVLVNFDRNGPVNPYLGAGFLYECTSFEADVYERDYYGWRHHPYHEDWDDDGITFLLRAGLDLRLDILYARFDASYIGEIYDEDDGGQFLLSGDLGVHIVPIVRLDLFGHYFTEYKSFYVGIGATVAL
jgi:hypothetical protein